MGGEDKKNTIRKFFDGFGSNDVAAALSCLDDSVTWRVMGREGGLPMSGEMDKDGITGLMGVVADNLKNGLKLNYKEWTIDGDRVAVEMESHGEKLDGTPYNNHYHFIVVFADGKIRVLREYGDTYHVWRVFIDGA